MKKILLTLATVVFTLLFSCAKDEKIEASVIRDCTGTYLQVAGKDYHVCNLEKVKSYKSGARVKAAFKKISVCNGSASEMIVCQMLHANEGWIEVTAIK